MIITKPKKGIPETLFWKAFPAILFLRKPFAETFSGKGFRRTKMGGKWPVIIVIQAMFGICFRKGFPKAQIGFPETREDCRINSLVKTLVDGSNP